MKHPLLTPKQLSVGLTDFRDQMSIPEAVLDGVWKKATNLLISTNAITKAPGSDKKAHLVWEPPSYGNTEEEWAVCM